MKKYGRKDRKESKKRSDNYQSFQEEIQKKTEQTQNSY